VGAHLSTAWSGLALETRLQGYWMGWNLLLAVLPGLGAIALYKWRGRRGILWWAGVVGVGLMLPNAPYVITDIIHLPPTLHYAPSRAAVVAGLLPLFVILIGGGVLSYVLTLRLLRLDLRRRGWSVRRRIAAEAMVDVACAVGVALGRIPRLNSWDVVHPGAILHGLVVVAGEPQAVVLVLIGIVVATVTVDRAATMSGHVLQTLRHRLRAP
jgi:uncharacterized membrane protein